MDGIEDLEVHDKRELNNHLIAHLELSCHWKTETESGLLTKKFLVISHY